MKIIVLSPFTVFPPTSGASRRVYAIVRYLLINNKVILVSFTAKSEKQGTSLPFTFYNINSRGLLGLLNPLNFVKILKIVKKEKPNLIISETILVGFHSLFLRLVFGLNYVLDEHNVEYLRLRRLSYGNKLWPSVTIIEKALCRFAEKVLCVSELDKQYLAYLGVKREKIYVMPNGVDSQIFYPNKKKSDVIKRSLGIKEKVPIVLFFGALDYEPNKEAVYIILNEIAPRVNERVSKAIFLIIGRNPPSVFDYTNNVRFIGAVDNIEDYINLSDVVICPLKRGGGTRLKILEAIACGKKVISTPIGAEGLLTEGLHTNLLLSDDWDDFSNKIIKVIKNPCDSLVPKNFLNRFSWDKIIQKFENDVLKHLNNLRIW